MKKISLKNILKKTFKKKAKKTAKKKVTKKKVTKIKKMQSKDFTSDLEGIFIKKAKGTANKTLAILEPTIFPIVIPS